MIPHAYLQLIPIITLNHRQPLISYFLIYFAFFRMPRKWNVHYVGFFPDFLHLTWWFFFSLQVFYFFLILIFILFYFTILYWFCRKNKMSWVILSWVQFSHSVMSDPLIPHGLQHARPPCPSPTPAACSNSCPSSWWCHPTSVILCHLLLLLPSIFPSIRVFSKKSVLQIRSATVFYCFFI